MIGFVGLLDESDALVGDFCVELLDGCNVLIDDRLVDIGFLRAAARDYRAADK